MGKIRVAKRYRLHLRGHSPTSEPSLATPSHALTSQPKPVPPLPKEVMERLPVLSLEDSQKVPPIQQKVPMKKKDRRKLRHEAWLKKIDVYQQARERAKAREERQKTVVVGDLHPLVDALPDLVLDEGMDKSGCKGSSKRPQRTIVKELGHFQEVLSHPAFVEDPLKTISLHIQNSLARGLT